MDDEDVIPAPHPTRREVYAGALALGLGLTLPGSGSHPTDDEFVMIDGWVLHRDDLTAG